MTSTDFAILILYFMLIGVIGWWSSRGSREDSKSYFLGGSHVGWMAIGASLFASNISAEHFIGLAGTGSASGLAVGQFEWLACIILLILGWLFVPFYLKTGVFTMPEFLEKRFNRACRTYLASVSLLAYVFTKISVSVYAGALVLNAILGWNIWVSATLLIVATGIYTLFGGLRAVIYTDFLQAGILISGGFLLTYLAIQEVGGISSMLSQTPTGYLNLWKPSSHPDFPWTGVLFGAPILGIWYWCTDQMIVQRTLAAKNLDHARKATIFAGFLKLLPVFLLVLPGLAGHILYPEMAPDKMYITLVNTLLPVGIKGLVIAGLLASLMSSLSSVFNSASTLVAMDFYRRYKPEAKEKELVRAGQMATIVMVIMGLLWLPLLGLMSEQIYLYLQSVQAYISPPIAAVFLAGVLWKRANGKGAFSALITGCILGFLRFASEIAVKAGYLTTGPLHSFATINFLHFAVLLFCISWGVIIGVSLLSERPSSKHLSLFENSGVNEAALKDNQRGLNLVLSGGLLLIVFLLWFLLSPLNGFTG